MSKNQQYAERYAAEAMEQMKRYGIPASVTLAQGILESRNGQSELSQLGNNHFGVKASKSWLKNGGDYLVYTDDKPNEKFCKYATVGDSYEHHSKILKTAAATVNVLNSLPMITRDGQKALSEAVMPPMEDMQPVCKRLSRSMDYRSMTNK